MNFWHKQYLLASLIDCVIINKFSAKDLIFLDVNCLYRAVAIQHTMSEIPGRYFAKAIQNQKIELNGI